jgi:hypothetical protein
LATIDFTGALIFQIPMCHDFATKSGSIIYNIILIIKLCFYTSGNGTQTSVFHEDFGAQL